MLHSLFSSLFGCAHQRTTFPLTPGRNTAAYQTANAARNKTYVVCLDCGKEFAYDWEGMRIGQQVTQPATKPVVQPVTAPEVQPQYR